MRELEAALERSCRKRTIERKGKEKDNPKKELNTADFKSLLCFFQHVPPGKNARSVNGTTTGDNGLILADAFPCEASSSLGDVSSYWPNHADGLEAASESGRVLGHYHIP